MPRAEHVLMIATTRGNSVNFEGGCPRAFDLSAGGVVYAAGTRAGQIGAGGAGAGGDR